MKLLFIICYLFLFSCGTETGNPITKTSNGNPDAGADQESTASELVFGKSCDILFSCYPSSMTLSSCGVSFLAQDGFDTVLGITDGLYVTGKEIVDAERSESLTPNTTEFDQCLADIGNLSCSDNEVVNAFDDSNPSDFSNAFKIIPTGSGSCNDIF
jgi:hypothetical protein